MYNKISSVKKKIFERWNKKKPLDFKLKKSYLKKWHQKGEW